MTDETQHTPDTHYVLVAAPGYYGDRTRILDAFPDLSAACKAAMQWGPQYVIRRSPRSRGEYWYCDLDHTHTEYWRADWNTGRVVHYPQRQPQPPAPTSEALSVDIDRAEKVRSAQALIRAAMDQGVITPADLVAVEWRDNQATAVTVKRPDGTRSRFRSDDIIPATTG